MKRAWSQTIRLQELAKGPVKVRLAPDAETRALIAKEIGLESLPALTADITVHPWLDGAEILGQLDAVVEQICGVSLDAFEQPLTADIEFRVVPAGSPNAPAESEAATVELEFDPDEPDEPDVLADEEIDLSAYLIEQLALEIDPFPRKPGAVFDYQPDTADLSPFAALKKLKGEGE